MEHIRRNVFGVTQEAFAKIVGVQQATISRWEKGEGEQSRTELDRIRTEARARDLPWDDDWFFKVPEASAETAGADT